MKESVSEAVFLTADHFISGKIMYSPRRFSDALNDPTVSWIRLLGVELARTNEPREIVATFPEMLLAKAHILVAIITQEPPYVSQRRLLAYTHRNPERLHVCIPPYEIEGVGYLEKAGELRAIFSVEARAFLPLTTASIVLASNPDIQLRADVIMVNRQAICGLSRSEGVSAEGETQDQPPRGAPSADEQ